MKVLVNKLFYYQVLKNYTELCHIITYDKLLCHFQLENGIMNYL